MLFSEVARAPWQDTPQTRIFPSAIRNTQNTQLNMKTKPVKYDTLEESGILSKLLDFDLFSQDVSSQNTGSGPKQANVAKLHKPVRSFTKRRPFNYRSPAMIAANIERYTTNFTNPDTSPIIKVGLLDFLLINLSPYKGSGHLFERTFVRIAEKSNKCPFEQMSSNFFGNFFKVLIQAIGP